MALFALAGSITPGPVNLLAIRRATLTPRGGATLAYVLGASLSYTAVVGLMGLGGQQWLFEPPWRLQALKWAGAAYLLHLAWRLARTAPGDWAAEVAEESAPAGPGHHPRAAPREGLPAAFVQGWLTQSLNPKAWLVALSGVGLFVLPQADAGAALGLFCAVSLLACGLGVGCWALAGRLLAHWLAAPARQKAFNRAMALLLAASVAAMLR